MPARRWRPGRAPCWASCSAEITPGDLDQFLFTLGGADANENAVKLARAYTGRHKILARYRSYHGAIGGAMALTGDPRRLAWEPQPMPGVVHFLDPYRYRSTFHRTNPDISEAEFTQDYLNHLEEIIQYEGPRDHRRHPDGDGDRHQRRSSSRRKATCRACARCATTTASC